MHDCLMHTETLVEGIVFTHYAYYFRDQVIFKCHFYGYDHLENCEDVGKRWEMLGRELSFPYELADIFPWLQREARFKGTIVDFPFRSPLGGNVSVSPLHIHPPKPHLPEDERELRSHTDEYKGCVKPLIIIDGVIFQSQSSYEQGISRVWKEALPYITEKAQVIFLSREKQKVFTV